MMATLPFALVGGFWFIYLLGHHVSVASGVGFIALAGVAAEFGVVMLIYLDRGDSPTTGERRAEYARRSAQRHRRRRGDARAPQSDDGGRHRRGAAAAVRRQGTGSEVMQRIAAPMIGGMITAPLLSMIVLPAAYLLLRRRSLGTGSA